MNRPTRRAKTVIATLLFLAGLNVGTARGGEPAPTKLTQEDNRVVVLIGGKPFTEYWFGPTPDHPYVRPFMYPVLAPDGVGVTSDQINVKGGDHPHHRSLWVAHGDVNGVDHWSLAKQLKGESQPQQKHVKFEKLDGDTLVEDLQWQDNELQPMLNERRTVRFFEFPDQSRGIDITSEFTPVAGPVKFGDTKEAGLCAVRMAGAISAHATITESTGATAIGDAKNAREEKTVWGKAANWCDESGEIDGKPYGVAIFDNPSNPRHPSTWHVRLYGLMAANIFGLHDFDKANPKGAGDLTIDAGKNVTFRYRVVVHTGDAGAAGLEEKYKEYVAEQQR
jgi:hypothetical protein